MVVNIVKDIHYNYDIQAWIVNGAVDKCGHPVIFPDCTACKYAGKPEIDVIAIMI